MRTSPSWTSIAAALCLLAAGGASAQEQTEAPPRFAIHLVAGPLTVDEARAMVLDELPLEETAFLTEQDIEAYHWPAHGLQVSAAIVKRLNEVGMAAMKPARPDDPPRPPDRLFVVSAGGERIYLGVIWPALRSSFPGIPHIPVPLMVTEDGPPRFGIGMLMVEDLNDPRGDPRVREALERAGVLHESP